MKKNIWFSLLILFVITQTEARANSPTHIENPFTSIAIENSLRAHIEFLASDNLRGRNTGSNEYEIAAKYVASHFTQFGLKPAGENNTWFQSVPFVKSTLNNASSKMVLHSDDNEIQFRYPEQFVLLPSTMATKNNIRSKLVFVGYGIESKALKHNDYADLNVRGKIVVMLAGRPITFAGEVGAHVSNLRQKLSNAEHRGATGVIMLHTPQEKRFKPYQHIASFVKKPFLNWKTKKGKVFDSYPNLQGKAYLSINAGKTLFSLAGFDLDTVFADIEAGRVPVGFDMNIEASLETESNHSTLYSSNIIGVLEGSDPTLKNEYVVYSAHLDHLGIQNEQENTINNGALDNASGVAILLEIARQLNLADRPKRSILFVVVTAEEKGMLGSNYFAHNPTVLKTAMVANINLDMPLILYPFADIIAFGAQHSSLKSYVESSAKEINVNVIPDPMPEQALFVRSDHYSFVKQGIPSIYLIPGFTSTDPKINGAALFEEFIAKHYHQPSDDLSLPIHYGAGATFTKVNMSIGTKIANGAERPRWNDESFFGEILSKQF